MGIAYVDVTHPPDLSGGRPTGIFARTTPIYNIIFSEHLAKVLRDRPDDDVDVALANDQRRRQSDRIPRLTHHHAILEAPFHQLVPPPSRLSRIRLELDRTHESDVAHVDHVRQSIIEERMQSVLEVRTHPRGPRVQVLVAVIIQGRQSRRHRHRMTRVRVSVEQFDARRPPPPAPAAGPGWRGRGRRRDGVVYFPLHEHGTGGDHGIRESLRARDHVGYHAEVLGCRARAEASEARDHLVEYEEYAVLGAYFTYAFQVTPRRRQHPRRPGHRFEYHRRDRRRAVQRHERGQFLGEVASPLRLAARAGVTLPDVRRLQMIDARDHATRECPAIVGYAAHGHAPEPNAVIPPLPPDETEFRTVPPRDVIRQRDFHRRVHGRRAAHGEEDVVQSRARHEQLAHEPIRVFERLRMGEEEGWAEIERRELILRRPYDRIRTVTSVGTPQARGAVEYPSSVGRPVVHPCDCLFVCVFR